MNNYKILYLRLAYYTMLVTIVATTIVGVVTN
jgi:hypothetical protein